MTATRPNARHEVLGGSGEGLRSVGDHDAPREEPTDPTRLRAELEALRAEYELLAASERALRLRLAHVERESEERAVRLMLAEEDGAARNGARSDP